MQLNLRNLGVHRVGVSEVATYKATTRARGSFDPSLFVIKTKIQGSNYDEILGLIWENGQLSMHGLAGLQPTNPTQEKPILNSAHDTLESIVQHATCPRYQPSKFTREKGHAPTSNRKNNSIGAPDGGEVQGVPSSARKRTWSNANNMLEECDILSGCASAGATF
ncbi:hypothetical protein JHK85_010727 [Glycine max]|nr:hypothetical protein JHK85_010727 [Glycine max]